MIGQRKKRIGRLGTGMVLILLLLGTSHVARGRSPAPGKATATPDTLTIEVVPGRLKYATTAIKAEAGTQLTIRFVNNGMMPHNVVFVKSREDIRPVGIAAVQAHETDYIPETKKGRIIAHTSLAGPGATVAVTFTVPPPGEYPYICTFPGHFQSMQGTLTSVETLASAE